MRRATGFVAVVVGVSALALGAIAACTDADEGASPPNVSAADAADGAKGSSSSGGGGTDATTSTPSDASATNDAASDSGLGTDVDADAPDSAFDAGPERDAATEADAADAAPEPSNVALLGQAVATSLYSGSYPASNLIDGDLATSWYPSSDCTSNSDGGDDYVCTDIPVSATLTLDKARTIGRVKLFGNRDEYPTGYDVFTARIELLDAADAVVYSATVTTSRGAEPNGDVDHAIAPAKSGVRKIRVVILTGEALGPGLGEIEAYKN